MKRETLLIWLITLVTLFSGFFNLISLIRPFSPAPAFIDLPLVATSRLLTLLVGLALVVSAVNVYRRRRLAYYLVLGLAVVAALAQVSARPDLIGLVGPLLLLLLLARTRHLFTTRTGRPDLGRTLVRIGLALLAALTYGTAGFWWLGSRDFGRTFSPAASLVEAVRYLLLLGDPALSTETAFGRWFLLSLSWITVFLLAYVLYSLFRPIAYQLNTRPHERARAEALLKLYGRAAEDYFKLWPDKSYFFSSSGNCVVAYGVSGSFALALGDPVGPAEEIAEATAEFLTFCRENGWGVAFHNTLPDFLPVYETLGLRRLQIGEEALVDLTTFTLEGKQGRWLRKSVNKLEREGIALELVRPPLPDAVLAEAQEVSDEWLTIPGRRERTFTLGQFVPEYVQQTPMLVARDASGRMVAFVTIIPSYAPGQATADLMRRRRDAPNGIMDYLFIKLFEYNKAEGFSSFSLGLAPLSGYEEIGEEATLEEKALRSLSQRLDFLFGFTGLRQYKGKFATDWKPRYAVYGSPLALPRYERALSHLSTVPALTQERWFSPGRWRRFGRVTLELVEEIQRLRRGG
ncbi:MAG: phosphatidylglycerol lysyltransferase domain-containing protein [Candidatus Promineifilaceae bacterium]|nr:phosphatidylglycerol lysyltransferase domain-containing protein [Candidatus Promineifilaceae bacterium]